MVVNGGHFEDSLFAQLVAAYLEQNGKRFDDEHAANEGQEQFLADDDRHGADSAAEGERTHIAHKNFGRVGVVPEKADRGAHHGSAKDGELADAVKMRKFKVVGEDHVPADVSQDGKRTGGNDGAADGQAVEAVGEIDGVGGAGEHDDH